MLTLRVPTSRLGLVQELEADGFRLMDCLVYYEAQTAASPSAKSKGFALHGAIASDADQVAELARICFTDYISHYHADPRLDRSLASAGYVDWARRSSDSDRKIATTVFLPLVGDRVVQFATMRRNSETEPRSSCSVIRNLREWASTER